jgi:hypothetical protein
VATVGGTQSLFLHSQRRQTGEIGGAETFLGSECAQEAKMRISIALAALLTAGFVATGTEAASAAVYCQYVSYPAGCIVRPGVVLRARPIARRTGVGARRFFVRRAGPMNRGGPVNRIGRR